MNDFDSDEKQEYDAYLMSFEAVQQKLFNVFRVLSEQVYVAKKGLKELSIQNKESAEIAKKYLKTIEEII